MSEAESFIDSMLSHHLIAVVVYSSIPACQAVLDNISLLQIRSKDLVILDLDEFDGEEATELRQYLYKITHRYDMPFVFFRGTGSSSGKPTPTYPFQGVYGVDKGDFYFSELQQQLYRNGRQ
ncbi:hypothetical protein E3P92_04033 [Wallemia ichthyophaga]|uniref:Glutaredoxin domain-containing protein n=1 Tax=Wallemia ichthyophaga TaxID=245174 RepID=A0A4T0JIX8_WALIC|nr:hypothetical protein E3P98_03686 [Wallemia ichthyophaga]TIA95459.1 hypothetical protein E3P94_04047 [Wallemia ichthyophaga]TIA97590.1 hypothetical protein E3P96_03367 [Wallemia ichthyophaga]TIB07111.1 hypothetical protein E3P93_04017 [Wallemia ichthyophaga]TIB07469.1 hypothetical protein E3P92_04033 [Wallemia ichthyophaga]